MSENIDIAIKQFGEIATDNRNEQHYWENRPNPSSNTLEYAQKACKRAEENEQIVALLEELKERREADRWIPVSERLPENAFIGCLVTVYETDKITGDECEIVLPYAVGYDGETWNDIDGEVIPFEVIAWRPLPEPYTESEVE